MARTGLVVIVCESWSVLGEKRRGTRSYDAKDGVARSRFEDYRLCRKEVLDREAF